MFLNIGKIIRITVKPNRFFICLNKEQQCHELKRFTYQLRKEKIPIKRFTSASVVFLILCNSLLNSPIKAYAARKASFILTTGNRLKKLSLHMHTVIMHVGDINIISVITTRNPYCRHVKATTI